MRYIGFLNNSRSISPAVNQLNYFQISITVLKIYLKNKNYKCIIKLKICRIRYTQRIILYNNNAIITTFF